MSKGPNGKFGISLEVHYYVFRSGAPVLLSSATGKTLSNGIATDNNFRVKLAQLEPSAIAVLLTNSPGKLIFLFGYNFCNVQLQYATF
jgi:hypothetical protein